MCVEIGCDERHPSRPIEIHRVVDVPFLMGVLYGRDEHGSVGYILQEGYSSLRFGDLSSSVTRDVA